MVKKGKRAESTPQHTDKQKKEVENDDDVDSDVQEEVKLENKMETDGSEFIKVAKNEDSDIMELPMEGDQSVLLSTLQAQFPNAIGLKYKGSTGCWRGIRAVDNIFYAPRNGWVDTVYYVAVDEGLKRKYGDISDVGHPKVMKTLINPLLKDIAVLNLSFKVTTEELKEYFSASCGELAFCEVMYDRDTKKSRGFGFIRFKTIEAAEKAVNEVHIIQGRKVYPKPKKDEPMQVFVGRLPKETTVDDVGNYFRPFGELKDIYLPSPFRGFGFITFASTEVARSVLLQKHFMNGSRLNLEERKTEIANQRADREANGTSKKYKGDSKYGGSDRYNPKKPFNNTDSSPDLKNMLLSLLLNQSKV